MGALIRGILDTSVVIGADAASLPDEAAISVITLTELHFGVLVARNDEARRDRLRRVTEVESRMQALPVSDAVARSYATLAHVVVTKGGKPRVRAMDLLVAATAHAHQVPVYTRNRTDFAPLEEVMEVRYA